MKSWLTPTILVKNKARKNSELKQERKNTPATTIKSHNKRWLLKRLQKERKKRWPMKLMKIRVTRVKIRIVIALRNRKTLEVLAPRTTSC